jgi:hypothetical protein
VSLLYAQSQETSLSNSATFNFVKDGKMKTERKVLVVTSIALKYWIPWTDVMEEYPFASGSGKKHPL